MSATSAERQRRYRAHHKGDHSLCLPDRCNDAGVTFPVTREAMPALGSRGRRMWRTLVEEPEVKPGPAQLVLVEEACRIADRLDRLDRQLRGDTDAWIRFTVNEDGSEVTVVIDRLMAEARQQAVALKQIVAELRQSQAAAKPAGRPSRSTVVAGLAAAAPPEVGSGVADLTARIRERRAQAEG